jgi:hypothetical protein
MTDSQPTIEEGPRALPLFPHTGKTRAGAASLSFEARRETREEAPGRVGAFAAGG